MLEDLAARGIELWTEGERLRFRGPEGALTAPLREELAAHKAEIIAMLRGRANDAGADYPVSFNQRSLFFLHRFSPASSAYNLAFATRIRSSVDVHALRDAFQALIDRHATLRTTYRVVNGELRQAIKRTAEIPFTEIHTSAWSAAVLHEKIVQRYREPFDLEHGPVIRVDLFTQDADEHVLLISGHHIALDGWSMWILLDELRTLYQARTQGTPAVLPRCAIEYTDYTEAQTRQLSGPEEQKLWTYWKTQLAGELPILHLPSDRPRPVAQTFSGASLTRWLTSDLQVAVKQLAKDEGATLFAVFLASYFVLLHRVSGQHDFIVGSPTFGRNRVEYQNLVGDCIGMVALRANLSGDPAFRDLLRQVRQVLVGALEHQDFPFALLVERLAQRRDVGRSPVFQTAFVYQKPQRASDLTALFNPGEASGRVDFGGLLLEAYMLPQQEGQFDFSLEFVETADALAATAKYNTDLFNNATAEKWMNGYMSLLEAIVENPAVKLSALATLEMGQEREVFKI